MPQGQYERRPEMFHREKLGRFKVFGLSKENSCEYFFLGVSKNYLCKIKSYMIYTARNNKHIGNKVYDTIRELDYKINITEIEALPKEFHFEQAKLYLQSNYLDKQYDQLTNKATYCFCNPIPSKNKQTPKEIRNQICEAYKEGKTTNEISQEFNIPRKRINTILTNNKSNKRAILNEAIKFYKENKFNLKLVVQNYPSLSKYMLEKVKETKIKKQTL